MNYKKVELEIPTDWYDHCMQDIENMRMYCLIKIKEIREDNNE